MSHPFADKRADKVARATAKSRVKGYQKGGAVPPPDYGDGPRSPSGMLNSLKYILGGPGKDYPTKGGK